MQLSLHILAILAGFDDRQRRACRLQKGRSDGGRDLLKMGDLIGRRNAAAVGRPGLNGQLQCIKEALQRTPGDFDDAGVDHLGLQGVIGLAFDDACSSCHQAVFILGIPGRFRSAKHNNLELLEAILANGRGMVAGRGRQAPTFEVREQMGVQFIG